MPQKTKAYMIYDCSGYNIFEMYILILFLELLRVFHIAVQYQNKKKWSKKNNGVVSHYLLKEISFI